jgi:hypothetical protein
MKIDAGTRFDSALANAEAWRRDALLYRGRRQQLRIDHAKRMEAIAERMVREA